MANNPVQYQNSGCGVLSAVCLLACLVYTVPNLLMEYQTDHMIAEYVPTQAVIYNVNAPKMPYLPGLRYTFGDEEYVVKTFFSEEVWPLEAKSWHQVKNKITNAGRRGDKLIVFVNSNRPESFALVDRPSRAVFFYTALLLAGVMVFGGLIWAANVQMKRKRWVKIENWE